MKRLNLLSILVIIFMFSGCSEQEYQAKTTGYEAAQDYSAYLEHMAWYEGDAIYFPGEIIELNSVTVIKDEQGNLWSALVYPFSDLGDLSVGDKVYAYVLIHGEEDGVIGETIYVTLVKFDRDGEIFYNMQNREETVEAVRGII